MPQIAERSSFWIIADAIKTFYNKHQALPLRGNVPDMKSQSKVYIQLQNIYKAKARKDVAEILATAQAMAPDRQFDPAEVELFCKNAPFVKLINATKGGNSASASRLDRLRTVTGKFLPLPWLLSARRPADHEEGVAQGLDCLRIDQTDISPQPRNWRTIKMRR